MLALSSPALTLLIADDHEAFLSAAERHLRRVDGIKVIGRAANGLDAVAQAEALKPDVVVLDLAMPEMGGLQATRLIKAQDQPPWIIIASHFDDPEHREHAQRAGADAFISKLNYIADLVPMLQARIDARSGAA